MQKLYNYINGKLTPAHSEGTLPLYNPSEGVVYGSAPSSDKEDVKSAISAAKDAFPKWSALSIDVRSRYLLKISELIESKLDSLAHDESLDNGKPLWLSKIVDVPRAASNFRFFGNAITQFSSESHEMTDAINYTLRHPLGVVACISPWNLPLYLFSWKIAPALAAGNTVVSKPSEVTPLTAYRLSEICIEAGLPPGVLNIVHGYGEDVGVPLTNHPEIKAVSFTGSTKVGKEIAQVAARDFKKVSLEMGGKNPNIIFGDCNYKEMLRNTLRSSFANQGQICLCGSRIYIERSIYKQFKEDFIRLTESQKVGHPFDEDTKFGAIVSSPHYEKILSYIELAKEEGGRILSGGHAIHPQGYEGGWYIAPTIIENLNLECRTNQEEIFGPVVTIMPFDTEDEAIQYANGTDYGLSASIWTENISRAQRMSRQIEAGIVWINTWLHRDLRTPFGGVKNSGMGREGGFEALKFFTEPKNICIKY